MTTTQRLLATAAAAGLAAGAFAQTTAPATTAPATTAPATTAPATTAPAAAAPATAPTSTTPAANAPTTTTQAAPGAGKVVAGATVMDTNGGQVGTIKSADASGAVIATGTHDVKLPLTSFAAGPNGPIIAMTKTQLDATASQAAASAQADLPSKLTVGSKVVGPQGNPVGTVEANDGKFVTVATAKSKARLPMSAFAAGPNGAVIGLTEAQLDAAAASAAPAPAGG